MLSSHLQAIQHLSIVAPLLLYGYFEQKQAAVLLVFFMMLMVI